MEYESDIMNIAVINFNPKYGKKKANFNKIKDFTIRAAKKGADLVLFPEMSLTGYDFYINSDNSILEKINLAEKVPGIYTEELTSITEKYKIYVIFGMPQKFEDSSNIIYNSATVVGPKGYIGSYQKIHPYDKENLWCTKGNKPFLFDTKWGPVSIGVCYDTYKFPELMRYYASKGSRLYLNLTGILNEPQYNSNSHIFKENYITYLQYGVLSNGIFIASANLVGYDGDNFYGGGSMVIGPKKTNFDITTCDIYAGSNSSKKEGIYMGTIDLSLAQLDIFQKNKYTNEPDYRKDLYRQFY